ncbi:Hypothetical predicted protein [Cloeon dipterum]|uniref:Transmembrane protein n=1 Tax=Cloeon dipterum TaxID=197152 RepID=A0A8S1D4X4_9INSE|nr:Hypothetical predicted protein [Cloeon dipterum]
MEKPRLCAILAACFEISLHLCLATRDVVQNCSSFSAKFNESLADGPTENYTELLTVFWQPSKILFMNEQSYASILCDLISILTMIALICALTTECKCLAWPWCFKSFAEISVGIYFAVALFSTFFSAPGVTYTMFILAVYKIFIICAILAGLIQIKRGRRRQTKTQDNEETLIL